MHTYPSCALEVPGVELETYLRAVTEATALAEIGHVFAGYDPLLAGLSRAESIQDLGITWGGELAHLYRQALSEMEGRLREYRRARALPSGPIPTALPAFRMGAALQLRSEEPVLEVRHRRTGVRLLRLTADSLSGADLRYQCLRGADLRLAELTHADLQGADLRGADLREADLRGADLRDANLRFADLRYADLRYVQYNRCTRWPRFFRLQPR